MLVCSLFFSFCLCSSFLLLKIHIFHATSVLFLFLFLIQKHHFISFVVFSFCFAGTALINIALGFRLQNKHQCLAQGLAFLYNNLRLCENSQVSLSFSLPLSSTVANIFFFFFAYSNKVSHDRSFNFLKI